MELFGHEEKGPAGPAESTAASTPLLSVRVVWADYYMAPPLPQEALAKWGDIWETLYQPQPQVLESLVTLSLLPAHVDFVYELY